jgi:hypothetical protein
MAKAQPIMKGGKRVGIKIGRMIVKGEGGKGSSSRGTFFGYFGCCFRNRRSNYETVRTYPGSIRLR